MLKEILIEKRNMINKTIEVVPVINSEPSTVGYEEIIEEQYLLECKY